ncbi:DUF2958 domain-containing protein [Halobacteriovorax sp. GB3]|uniref:DUF2958 domain-containing protein n=1 Tax=Halobacteriovorax sp. GB3 TaxID=2719615 RepID=UPI00235DCA00|nr:DUF2958 domain-containing protein [Halobacteriovorax sp. GB3]MDD0851611.1 DUF2958 domain-containing protein [Halobacteriovorax sp. GB3]
MITKKRRLEALKKASRKKTNTAIAMMHFYNPIGKGDWFITHAQEIEGEIVFIGVVYFNSFQWQEFSLSKLKNTKLPFGEKIKYNPKFQPVSISVLKHLLSSGEDFRP